MANANDAMPLQDTMKEKERTLNLGASGIALGTLESFPGPPDVFQCNLFCVSVLKGSDTANELSLLLLNGELDPLVDKGRADHQFLDLDMRHLLEDQIGLLFSQKVLVSRGVRCRHNEGSPGRRRKDRG